jgi:hypothetical protein
MISHTVQRPMFKGIGRVLEIISRVIRGIAMLVFLALTAGFIVFHILARNKIWGFKIAATVNFVVWIAISYVVYLVFSALSLIPFKILTAKKAEDTFHYLQRMVSQAPRLTMNVSCYHHETRTVSRSNGNGGTTLSTETVRVTTHTEQIEFPYSSWEDLSDSVSSVQLADASHWRKPCLNLSVQKSWLFTDQSTVETFKAAALALQVRNRYKDRYMDYNEDMYLEGFQHTSIVVFQEGKRPFLFGIWWWLLATFLFLNIPYCFYIDYLYQDVEFNLKKRVSILQADQTPNDRIDPIIYHPQQKEDQTSHQQQQQYYQSSGYVPPDPHNQYLYQQQQQQSSQPVVVAFGTQQHDGFCRI